MKATVKIILFTLVLSILSGWAMADSGWYCPQCGRYKESGYSFCPNDGTANPFGASGAGETAVSVHTGDYVMFGTYEQDNNTKNGREAIEWRVLDVRNGQAFLISRYGLDLHLFHPSSANVSWADCEMRTWLNGTFMNSAFSDSERNAIATTHVCNDSSTGYPFGRGSDIHPKYGPDTDDRIFLLSWQETQTYFSGANDLRCQATDYARKHGAKVMSNGYCWWWLRSPGYTYNMAMGINSQGTRVPGDQHVDNNGKNTGLVRPALWVSLSGLGK